MLVFITEREGGREMVGVPMREEREEYEEEEERLSRMVNEFLECEAEVYDSSAGSRSHHLQQDDPFLSLKRIVVFATEEERVVHESVTRHLKQSRSDGRHSLKEGIVLRLRMEGYDVSLCRSSWASSMDCPGGAYDYVDMKLIDSSGHTRRLIVDIDFKSQFEIARPTADYIQLCGSLPKVFVGSEEKLSKIISLLCTAAKKSLTESGLHIPPWRKASYMNSKWSSCVYQRGIKTASFPTLDIDSMERVSAKINNWSPPNLVSMKRRSGLQESGLSKEFASFRCPTVA